MTSAVDNPFAAPGVGAVYAHGRPYHHPRSLARIREYVGAAPVDRALDLACGTGMSTVALAEQAGFVIGVDRSPAMLVAARTAPNAAYIRGQAERLPFPAATFGAVTCCSGIHWFDQTRAFAELHRVLEPDGWVGLYDHYFMKVPAAGFKAWTRTLFERYPLPPRAKQVGDPRAETPAGFRLVGEELFEDPIAMTHDEFVDYQLTVSHCVAAVERGEPRADVRAWVAETSAPLFAGHATQTVAFLGSITCLRVA
jgi:ubiquinone/menaquinone biosynthesis C-methylase UbiE